MATPRKKAGPDKGIVETRPFVTYLPAGVRIDPYKGNEPLLDPDLAKIRDEESKVLAEVRIEPRPEPTIDPELVKAREAELKRDAKRAEELGLVEPKKAPVKKAASSKSDDK